MEWESSVIDVSALDFRSVLLLPKFLIYPQCGIRTTATGQHPPGQLPPRTTAT